MEYEYSFLHTTGDITQVVLDTSPQTVAAAFQQALDSMLDLLASQVGTHKEGGWEALSHDFLLLANHILLVTFFLRRPKPS
ncbi:MAG: hypothetical protein HY686_07090 [Chloroflexi bacterium]|nr:hypothetical protein [Chloroflexota bacterium]